MSTVALVALARPTFDLACAQANFDSARALLIDLGATVVGPAELVMTVEDVAAVTLPEADLHILFMASFSDASPAVELLGSVKGPILGWSMREPGEVGERLKLNSMCGVNLAAHALKDAGQSIRHIHGNADEAHVRTAIADAIAGKLPAAITPANVSGDRAPQEVADKAFAWLKDKKVGAVGEAPVGFTPCLFDGPKLNSLFGLDVRQISIDNAFERISAVEPARADKAYAAALAAQPSLGDVNVEQAKKVYGVEVALDDWREEDALDAIAIRCWPEFPTDLGACICSSLGRLSDRGTVTTCERDVLGAVTMLVCEALGSDENYLVDIVDLVEKEGLLRLWHCGSAATKLAADPKSATQYIHCNRKLGVAGNFPLKTGPVTLFRIDRDVDPSNSTGLRMVVSRGESIPAPNHFQGNTATVRTEPDAAVLVNGIVTGGYPHHLVISWIDVRPGIRTMADMLGIPLTEW
ncbi:FucI L-fucose isomerase and related proteins [Candidatus Nanopelagicaceae bacterium]